MNDSCTGDTRWTTPEASCEWIHAKQPPDTTNPVRIKPPRFSDANACGHGYLNAVLQDLEMNMEVLAGEIDVQAGHAIDDLAQFECPNRRAQFREDRADGARRLW